MSESVRLRWAASLTLLLLAVPVASAWENPLSTGDSTEEIRAAADDARLRAQETGDGILDPDGDGEAGSDGGGSSPQKPISPSAVLQPVRDAVQPILDQVPDDPLGFVDDQVGKAQDTAAALTDEVVVFSEAEPEVQEPAPAAAAADPMQPLGVPSEILVVGATAAVAAIVLWLAGSSTSLGGAAGASASAKMAPELRRLLPFASPLFTRFEKDTVLGHPKREHLYALILQEPGVSLQNLCVHTGLSRTAVTHHLRLLELQHLVVSRRLGRSRHYYENGGRFRHDQKEAYAVLQNNRSREVARYVQDHPGAIQKTVCEALGVQASIAHWHLRRLQDVQLVEAVRQGRTVSYFPSPALVQVAQGVAIPA